MGRFTGSSEGDRLGSHHQQTSSADRGIEMAINNGVRESAHIMNTKIAEYSTALLKKLKEVYPNGESGGVVRRRKPRKKKVK